MMKGAMGILGMMLIVLLGSSMGRKVVRVETKGEREVQMVERFATEHLVDVWSPLRIGPIDLLLPPALERPFEALSLPFSVLIADVDVAIAEERVRMAKNKEAGFFEEYQPLDEIYQWVRDLAAAHPSLVSLFVLGTTYEGREILGLKISSGRGATKEFFFNGGIHSREWVSPATTLYMINEMVTKYGQDANVTAMIDGLDWTIVPVLNPDGYVHTFTSDRLWRKNRQPNPGAACAGTDLNRNFPFRWNTGGSSNLPCSDAYHGPSAGSAPETQAIMEYLKENQGRLAGYIDIHAYSQLLMYPWGYTRQLTPDDARLSAVGNSAAAALQAVYGTQYEVGTIANIIYVASGSSADYTYGELGIVYSFAYELRDKGRYGFLLPPDQIIPSGIETFESLKVIALEGVLGRQ